jgi:hypothetical protein
MVIVPHFILVFQYDATQPGRFGGGGEYDVQDGFGWTNGVVLEFLDTYPSARFDAEGGRQPDMTNRKYGLLLSLLLSPTRTGPLQPYKARRRHHRHPYSMRLIPPVSKMTSSS